MAAADHSVGDNGREERFDRAETGDRARREDELPERSEIDMW
jgi:hypothetical protein